MYGTHESIRQRVDGRGGGTTPAYLQDADDGLGLSEGGTGVKL